MRDKDRFIKAATNHFGITVIQPILDQLKEGLKRIKLVPTVYDILVVINNECLCWD